MSAWGMTGRCLRTYFVDGVFALLAVHFADVDDLHDVGLAIGDRLDLDCVAKAALANDFELAISVHVCQSTTNSN